MQRIYMHIMCMCGCVFFVLFFSLLNRAALVVHVRQCRTYPTHSAPHLSHIVDVVVCIDKEYSLKIARIVVTCFGIAGDKTPCGDYFWHVVAYIIRAYRLFPQRVH